MSADDLDRLARVLEPEGGDPWDILLSDGRSVYRVNADDEERARAVAVGWLAGAAIDELLLARAGVRRHRGRRMR